MYEVTGRHEAQFRIFVFIVEVMALASERVLTDEDQVEVAGKT